MLDSQIMFLGVLGFWVFGLFKKILTTIRHKFNYQPSNHSPDSIDYHCSTLVKDGLLSYLALKACLPDWS